MIQQQGGQLIYSPFAAGVFITDKVLTLFVDGVVCEMHANFILNEDDKHREIHLIQKLYSNIVFTQKSNL